MYIKYFIGIGWQIWIRGFLKRLFVTGLITMRMEEIFYDWCLHPEVAKVSSWCAVHDWKFVIFQDVILVTGIVLLLGVQAICKGKYRVWAAWHITFYTTLLVMVGYICIIPGKWPLMLFKGYSGLWWWTRLCSISIYVNLDVNRLNLPFILLTAFIIPLCVLYSWPLIHKPGISFFSVKTYLSCFLFIELFLINAFLSNSVFWFFIFFEATLIPMMFIIGVWGPGSRRIKSNYYFIFYTLMGSVFMLLGVLIIFMELGSHDFLKMLVYRESGPAPLVEDFIFICMFIGFAVKVPIYPLHLWLPEAHVEAPTAGSVVLAALLLKLGGYGCVRFASLLPHAYTRFSPFIIALCVISIMYASFSATRQIDIKKIVAYSSIAHMNLGVIGVFTLTNNGFQGALFLMISHGIISSAMFFLIGFIYDRHHTKLLKYYGGLVSKMPVFSTFFFFFSFSNVAFPGTSSFIGEFLIFLGLAERNFSMLILAGLCMVFSAVYTIWLFNRLVFGLPKITYITEYVDLTRRELLILLPLVFATVILGFKPGIMLELTAPAYISCGDPYYKYLI